MQDRHPDHPMVIAAIEAMAAQADANGLYPGHKLTEADRRHVLYAALASLKNLSPEMLEAGVRTKIAGETAGPMLTRGIFTAMIEHIEGDAK